MNWSEAQLYCRDNHTVLATVTNMTDMDRLRESAHENGAWIGLKNQTDANRKWYWSPPGVEFNETETNWDTGEPNDHDQNENCGAIQTYLNWTDVYCQTESKFLCYDESSSTTKFHLIEDHMTWFKAQRYCREKHTDLVSGVNQLQEAELQTKAAKGGTFMLFGLFRDTWKWSDGSGFSFRDWDERFNDNDGECAMINFKDNNHFWKNCDCADKKTFFCHDDKVILIKENKTWEDALYYCRKNYIDLVTITNLDEQRWVQEKAKNASTPFVWLGLRYTCTLDFWFWVSDEVVGYKNWDSEKTDECDMSGAMKSGGQHEWVKQMDNQTFNFICSKN
ncbi:C-type mannose receptor 2-like [Embiotoca jacksoni]|uniref:C-type mannose receptor 2-like n=1 Tax=Embiotoca jacksoni TaxID=100190 RepID=UPI003703CE52